MQKVRVSRYVTGKRPEYAPQGSSDEEDEDFIQRRLEKQKEKEVCMAKGAFPLHWASGSPRTGCCLHLAWCRTLDPRPLFAPNSSVPDYFGTNQLRRTQVSGNDNHSLLITSNSIQFFHYRLPLCPVQPCAVSRVHIVAKSNTFPFPMILV